MNGEAAASSAKFQFWVPTPEAVRVTIRGPGGRVVHYDLVRGAYALSSLPSGDYEFLVNGSPPLRSVVTVNRELGRSEAP